MTDVRIKIDLEAGTIKYEGPQEFFAAVVEEAVKFSKSIKVFVEPSKALNVPAGRPKSHRAKKNSESKGANNGTVKVPSVDAKSIADTIKGSERFDVFKSHFILKEKDFLNKSKLAMFFYKDGLTTGDIERVFKELGVRMSLPSISKAVNGNKDQFFVSDDKPARFSLTEPTRVVFEKYLSELDG